MDSKREKELEQAADKFILQNQNRLQFILGQDWNIGTTRVQPGYNLLKLLKEMYKEGANYELSKWRDVNYSGSVNIQHAKRN